MDTEFINKLLILYPEYNNVYGPYKNRNDRLHIILTSTTGNRHTISYPKALVEVRENRKLIDNETVDHDDGNKNNDELNNLIIRDKIKHVKLDAIRLVEKEGNCIWCGKSFTLSYRQLGKARNKAGPFCSRSCSGMYGASIQNGSNELSRSVVNKEYYKLKDMRP